MAVRVEPPRGRPGPREPERYPGLTLEERGYVPPSILPTPPELEPPPPLWLIPSDAPQESRSGGFLAPLVEPVTPRPPEQEGLFDVPGLLERLWLARALEANRERSWHERAAGTDLPATTAELPLPAEIPPYVAEELAPPQDLGRDEPGRSPGARPLEVLAPPSFRPKSWVCPTCYLANDAGAATCRGCRSASLHF
jgi:hypothetical protein